MEKGFTVYATIERPGHQPLDVKAAWLSDTVLAVNSREPVTHDAVIVVVPPAPGLVRQGAGAERVRFRVRATHDDGECLRLSVEHELGRR